MASPPGLTTLLAGLATSGADFIVVGALAAVAQGAPLTTHDLDVVHRRTPENVDRIIAFLSSVNARHRGHPQALPPSRDALLGSGHNLFTTDLGPLDVLGAIEGGRGYEELLPGAVAVEVAGRPVQVLGLATLAELKRGSSAPRDQLVLAVLEETIRRISGQ